MDEEINYSKLILRICFVSCLCFVIIWLILFPPEFTSTISDTDGIRSRVDALIERVGNQQTVHITTTIKYLTLTEEVGLASIPPLLLTKSEPQFNIYINGDDNLVIPADDSWVFYKSADKLYVKASDEDWQLSALALDAPLNPLEHIAAFSDQQSIIERFQHRGCTYYVAKLLLSDTQQSIFYAFKAEDNDWRITEFSILIYDRTEHSMEMIQHQFTDWAQSYIVGIIDQATQTIPEELLH